MMPSRYSPVNPALASPYVAAPVYFLRLHDAVEKVNSGAIKPLVTEDRREYRFGHFSLLLAPN